MLGTGRAQIVNGKYIREQQELFADFLKVMILRFYFKNDNSLMTFEFNRGENTI